MKRFFAVTDFRLFEYGVFLRILVAGILSLSLRYSNWILISIFTCLFLLRFGFCSMPHSYDRSTDSQNIVDSLWTNGYHDLSASVFYQQAFGDDLSYVDGTFLGYYETGRLNGLKGGIGFIFAAPFVTYKRVDVHENYEDVKQIFLLDSIYADYLNRKYGIHITAGRYKSDEEWNTFNSQGFAITYDGIKNISLHLTASYGSALVLNEFVTPFRTELSSFGAYLLRARVTLPHHIDLEPYAYVTGFFTAFGIKTQISYRISRDLEMETKVHIAAYNKYYRAPNTYKIGVTLPSNKFEQAASASYAAGTSNSLSGIAWVEQEMIWNKFLEVKLGLIGVTNSGAELIDYYGHKAPFEYSAGIFWGGAFTPYAALGINMQNVFELEAGVRGTFSEFGNIFGLEAKGEYEFFLWKNYVKGKIGLSIVALYNNTAYPSPITTSLLNINTIPAVNFYGGNAHTFIRTFVRVSI